MNVAFRISVTGLIVLSLCSLAFAQPNLQNRVERWNGLWMNQTNTGLFGNDGPNYSGAMDDPCPPNPWAPQGELPGGSGQQYLFWAGLWIGALIVEDGLETKRVSVATDGWLSSPIQELWPAAEGFAERSTLDTINCFGDPIASPDAIADHEYTCVFYDTLRDPLYVEDDPVDGMHRPLGLKVTRTTYANMGEDCRHITWIKYEIENIGSNFLKNLYVGHYVDGDAGPVTENDRYMDDITGFDPQSGVAYIVDNDGRAVGDGSGNDFTAPHVLGTRFLGAYEPDLGWPDDEAPTLSYNWWMSNGDVNLDYGPAWQEYALRDSNGLGWTGQYGTPMGDEHKYQLMSNGEYDYGQVYADLQWWIDDNPQEDRQWTITYEPVLDSIANGADTRYLYSVGPVGIFDYLDASGRRIYRLNPGERFEIWFAWVGGLNFHDAGNPQPADTLIEPGLFNLADLRARAGTALGNNCLYWDLPTPERPAPPPAAFMLDPVYPNPFNATARVRFSLASESDLTLRVLDILGRETAILARGRFAPGTHERTWNASALPSGIYFIEARAAGGARMVQKAMLVR